MNFLASHAGEIALLFGQHLLLTLSALAVAAMVALPLGIFVRSHDRSGAIVLGILNVMYTIPSLALYAFLITYLGLGFGTALVALVAYAQMILVRNVLAGLKSVPPASIEAARGLGMSPLQSLVHVELPQALPVILGGVRIATIAIIAMATLGAWIDAGGLGVLIFYGLQHNDPERVVVGSLACALLALAADAALRAIERRAARRLTG
ncbi:MAG TPA: ABC transporter permease [Candidatus Acidoferrales bacterium]|nr:ABC transporter permease [Candidatus Acidoferrales bacterium]